MKRLRFPVVLCLSLSAVPLFAAQPSLRPAGSPVCEGAGCGVVADVDGDGLDDLLDFQRREVSFNHGGSFGTPQPLTGIADNESVTAAEDYNGDGRADLVLWPTRAPHDEGPNRMVYGTGTGAFTKGSFPVEYGGLGQTPPRDFNGDGKADLVLAKFIPRPGDRYDTTLSFLAGNGGGTFALDQQLTFRGSAYPFMAIADFNGDGHWDLVRTGDDSRMIYVHLAGPTGRLGAARERYVGLPVGQMQAADFNGDGLSDVVFDTSGPTGKSMFLLFNDGRGRFPAFAEMPSMNTPWGAVVGDIYPGGGAELALTHSNGRLTVYSAVGNVLQPVASLHIPQAAYYHANLLRLRSSGHRDFVVTVRDFSVIPNTNRTSVILVDGQLPETANARVGQRRARALRAGGAVDAFSAIVTGECVPALLEDWSFQREGMFFDFAPREDGTEVRGALVNGKLLTRVTAGTRMMTGSLTLAADSLRGYLYDQTPNPCGGTGRILVDAKRVN